MTAQRTIAVLWLVFVVVVLGDDMLSLNKNHVQATPFRSVVHTLIYTNIGQDQTHNFTPNSPHAMFVVFLNAFYRNVFIVRQSRISQQWMGRTTRIGPLDTWRSIRMRQWCVMAEVHNQTRHLYIFGTRRICIVDAFCWRHAHTYMRPMIIPWSLPKWNNDTCDAFCVSWKGSKKFGIRVIRYYVRSSTGHHQTTSYIVESLLQYENEDPLGYRQDKYANCIAIYLFDIKCEVVPRKVNEIFTEFKLNLKLTINECTESAGEVECIYNVLWHFWLLLCYFRK